MDLGAGDLPARSGGMNADVVRVGGFILGLPRMVLTGLVRLYQLAISPWLPASCRYHPSCSEYAILALREYGAVKGTILAVWRILRCAPWGSHGHDPPRWFGEKARTEGHGEDGHEKMAGTSAASTVAPDELADRG